MRLERTGVRRGLTARRGLGEGPFVCSLGRHGLMVIIGIIGDEWYHVWFPATGEYGFVKQSDLWEGNG